MTNQKNRNKRCAGCGDAGSCEFTSHVGNLLCPCTSCIVKGVCVTPCKEFAEYMDKYFFKEEK
jgi:hypothetical protein